jgi:hypothetical protein
MHGQNNNKDIALTITHFHTQPLSLLYFTITIMSTGAGDQAAHASDGKEFPGAMDRMSLVALNQST